jgi:hypothetical protein
MKSVGLSWQHVTAVHDEGEYLWASLIRLWLHSLWCYLQSVVVEMSLQSHGYDCGMVWYYVSDTHKSQGYDCTSPCHTFDPVRTDIMVTFKLFLWGSLWNFLICFSID